MFSLKVKNLTKVFKDKKREVIAVNDVSFEISESGVIAFLGPNGAGKTTLLRLILGLIFPDKGEVFVNGVNPFENPVKVRNNIIYLPTEEGIPPKLTPYEYLSFYADVYKVEDKEKRIKESLEKFEILDIANVHMDKLSTGQKQRVRVAKAYVVDRPILFLDEPTLGLDLPSTLLVENFIMEEKKKDKLIILATHIMEQAEYLADKVMIMNNGKIITFDTFENLKNRTKKQKLREIFLDLIKEN
ncbi:ABC transporter ATP-binding protein [Candidatus Pacearchaeota archaeon]|nr:MAG: ABC transporter ATP-binding protein [Candidatus Pacearchaeota archaeon]